MSHTSTHHVSICKKFKDLFSTTSQPSALASILDTVVQASSPYPAFAEGGKRLSKVLKKVEVGICPLSPASISVARFYRTGSRSTWRQRRRHENLVL